LVFELTVSKPVSRSRMASVAAKSSARLFVIAATPGSGGLVRIDQVLSGETWFLD
jgi:hypothetical protein